MRVPSMAVACLSALASLSACSSMRGMVEDEYVVTAATPDNITLRFREGNLNKATERADAHCKDTSRLAHMTSVTPDGGHSLASFRCGR